MKAEIISIGTELLLGEIVDTNSAHIARVLRDIGLDLFFTTTVGDNEERITRALNIALDRADVVITTGGLGPTVDDVTRQAAAAATSRQLVFRQELFDQIAERFVRFGSKMSENNRQQAYIPEGAIPIENPVGTAPCFAVESERGVVISLPGVPREMKYLLETAVVPYLRQRFNLAGVIKARVLRTAGIGESQVDDAITDLMKLSNPTVGLAAHAGQTDIRITAKANDLATADQMIATVEAQVRERVGKFIYGVEKDTIEEVLVGELKRLGHRLAVSETGPGNKLHERLTAVPGGPDTLAGAERFDSAEALSEALGLAATITPEELGRQAAHHAQDHFKAALGLAVIARPDLAIVAVVAPRLDQVRVYRFGEQEGHTVIWASTWCMAVAWRWLHHRS
jgi:nicotinamide-nucleotide amidase